MGHETLLFRENRGYPILGFQIMDMLVEMGYTHEKLVARSETGTYPVRSETEFSHGSYFLILERGIVSVQNSNGIEICRMKTPVSHRMLKTRVPDHEFFYNHTHVGDDMEFSGSSVYYVQAVTPAEIDRMNGTLPAWIDAWLFGGLSDDESDQGP